MPSIPRGRRVETVPARRRPPVAPKPDFRRIFLEPKYTDPDLIAAYEPGEEDEHADRRPRGGRGARYRTD
ncbi:hypothetical protein ACGRHY_28950 [Streptomyces sp. HK10]|uniref:hypothetical protein n=1 Tax=Streptomyces sp. HK10 TaxID=3373255 RepID=UPI0037483883